jgi:hypothetical protein
VVGGPTALAPPLGGSQQSKPVTGTARLSEVERLLVQADVRFQLRPYDKTAIVSRECRYTAAEIAGCYVAIYRGETGTPWLHENLNLEKAIEHIPAWAAKQEGFSLPDPRPKRGAALVQASIDEQGPEFAARVKAVDEEIRASMQRQREQQRERVRALSG